MIRGPLLAALSILAFAARADAYEVAKSPSGRELRWSAPMLPYDAAFTPTDPDGEALALATRRALDTWGHALRGRVVPDDRGVATSTSARDGVVTIHLAAPWDRSHGDPQRTVALTLQFYDTMTGALTDADLALNAETFTFADGRPGTMDTESVVLHEAGHVLGLAHSCGTSGGRYPSCFQVPDDPPGNAKRILEAVMAPTLSLGTIRRALGPDDLEGIEAHYGVSTAIMVPEVDALVRTCRARGDRSGALVVRGTFPAHAIVEVRRSTGARTRLRIETASTATIALGRPASLEEGEVIDVLVRDPDTRAYGAIDGVTVPALCSFEPEPPVVTEDDGCACVDGARLGSSPLLLAMFGALYGSRRRRRALPLLAFAALALLPSSALAYKCSRTGADVGPSLYWEERSVPWWANAAVSDDLTDKAAALEQVKLGFQAWEDVGCSDLVLPFQTAEPNLAAGFDERGANKNVVVFVESGWKYDPGIIAVTTNAFDTHTGRILDSDIEVNGAHFRFTIADDTCDARTGLMDVRNAITHEVGHVIGLDHPPNTQRYSDTTMFASAPPCEIKKRTLAQDDIDGICAIYPSGEATKQCYPPDAASLAEVDSSDGFDSDGCTDLRADRGSRHEWWGSLGVAGALGLVFVLSARRPRRVTSRR